MKKEGPSDGTPFSRTDLRRRGPERDSPRFRERLGAYCSEHLEASKSEIVSVLQRELNLDLPLVRVGYFSITEFFRAADLQDVLKSIAHIWRVLARGGFPDMAHCWLEFVQRLIEEEELGYRLDGEGEVHPWRCEESERSRHAALRRLEDPRYAGVLTAVEAALQKLDSDPPDTKGTVLCMLEGLEILLQLITNSERSAGFAPSEVRRVLGPRAREIYKDETSRTVAGHLLDGLCGWIEALQIYRERPAIEAHGEPPLGLTNYLIDCGLSYLGWLVELDHGAR